MKAVTLVFIGSAAVTLLNSSCSNTSTQLNATEPNTAELTPPPQQFDKNSLVAGKRYSWVGTLTVDGNVLVGSETDERGNVINYIADIQIECNQSEFLGVKSIGRLVAVEGYLRSITTGLTAHHGQPGYLMNTNKSLWLQDCHVRFVND